MLWSRLRTIPYLYFLSSLFVSPNKLSVWLCLCQAMDQNQGCEADVDGVSHVENGHKKSGVYELGLPWIHSKILSLDRRRISLQENRPLPFSRCGRIPRKEKAEDLVIEKLTMQGHDGRWTLHKVQQCSWAWIHVDTLNFTTNGQGKNSSAWKSHWERTSRYPFWGRGPGKTGSWLRPPTRACPKEQEKFHLLTGPFDSVLQFFFHENGLVNSFLNRNW